MAINLLAITPHKVSRDLSGYITYIYGEPKTGKTSLAAQMQGCLLLAFEKGYNAIPGIMAQDITSWSDLKSVVRELRKPEVQKIYKSVIVDTIDIAAGLCEKYVCQQADVDTLGDVPYGGGWAMAKKEFEDVFRTITQLGYALVFISHAKEKEFKRKDGTSYNQIVPSCPSSFNEIAKNMADLYCYAAKYNDNGTSKVKMILRSDDNSVDTGSRFKYIVSELPEFSYQALVDALNEAIDKEAKSFNNEFVTDERGSTAIVAPTFDYDKLVTEFGDLAKRLVDEDPQDNPPKIRAIVEKVLGKGRKVSETTRNQAELISVIIDEIKGTMVK